jgi:hypothetical protein
MEYFLARLVLLAAGPDLPLSDRCSRVEDVLATPGRRIQQEPEALHFLEVSCSV